MVINPIKGNTEDVRMLQRALNEKMQTKLVTDGDPGPATQSVLRNFQNRNGLAVTGVYGEKEDLLLGQFIALKYLRMSDIDKLAPAAGLPANMIKAFTLVEAKSDGFLPSGKPLILYERHKFYQFVVQKFGKAKAEEWKAAKPNICWPEWTRDAYFGGDREYDRLAAAMALDSGCAMLSTSWGLFQVMGFNFKEAGYDSVVTFVEAMKKSEKEHLNACMNFIKSNPKLLAAVKAGDCTNTALYYNGPGYAQNQYDTRLAEAKRQFS